MLKDSSLESAQRSTSGDNASSWGSGGSPDKNSINLAKTEAGRQIGTSRARDKSSTSPTGGHSATTPDHQNRSGEPGTELLDEADHGTRYTPEYMASLLQDKKRLVAFPNVFANVERILDEEIEAARMALFPYEFSAGKTPLELPEPEGEPKVLQEKVYVPVKQFPDYNFVGRILGPRGMTAKQLEKETDCKIMVRGKGSMRDKKKEEPEGEDELKRKQLMELAIINGTFRPGQAQAANLAPRFIPAGLIPLPIGLQPTVINPQQVTLANLLNAQHQHATAAGLQQVATSLAGGSGSPLRHAVSMGTGPVLFSSPTRTNAVMAGLGAPQSAPYPFGSPMQAGGSSAGAHLASMLGSPQHHQQHNGLLGTDAISAALGFPGGLFSPSLLDSLSAMPTATTASVSPGMLAQQHGINNNNNNAGGHMNLNASAAGNNNNHTHSLNDSRVNNTNLSLAAAAAATGFPAQLAALLAAGAGPSGDATQWDHLAGQLRQAGRDAWDGRHGQSNGAGGSV